MFISSHNVKPVPGHPDWVQNVGHVISFEFSAFAEHIIILWQFLHIYVWEAINIFTIPVLITVPYTPTSDPISSALGSYPFNVPSSHGRSCNLIWTCSFTSASENSSSPPLSRISSWASRAAISKISKASVAWSKVYYPAVTSKNVKSIIEARMP